MTPAPDRRRPVIVTVVTALVCIGALLDVGIGILILLSRYDQQSDADVLAVSLTGIGVILFGLLSLAVAGGLARGSRLSRVLVTVYAALRFALQVVTLLTSDAWDVWSLAQMLLGVAIVTALWAPPGARWFRSDSTTVPREPSVTSPAP